MTTRPIPHDVLLTTPASKWRGPCSGWPGFAGGSFFCGQGCRFRELRQHSLRHAEELVVGRSRPPLLLRRPFDTGSGLVLSCLGSGCGLLPLPRHSLARRTSAWGALLRPSQNSRSSCSSLASCQLVLVLQPCCCFHAAVDYHSNCLGSSSCTSLDLGLGPVCMVSMLGLCPDMTFQYSRPDLCFCGRGYVLLISGARWLAHACWPSWLCLLLRRCFFELAVWLVCLLA